MKRNAARFLQPAMAFFACTAAAEKTGNTAPPRHITLQEPVQLALKHNHHIRILIAQAHRKRTESRLKTSEDLQSERVEQVKFGSTLAQELIDSRAQLLQGKQEILTTDLSCQI